MTDDTLMTAGEPVDILALRRWLRDQEDEIRKLTGELHRVKLDRLDGAKRIDELLAEIEQFRGYNTVTHKIIEDQQSEIERLRAAGER